MSARLVPGPVADVVDALLEASIAGSFTRIGYAVRRIVEGWDEPGHDSRPGRTVLVTGANSGLGLSAAHGFATEGARVILLGRDRGRLDDACDEIASSVPDAQLESVVADLGRLDDMHAVAAALADRFDHLDVLVHNAGALARQLERTVDDVEVTVQTHVVAPFLLTRLLLPLLAASPDPRVISVVSGGLYTARLSVASLDALLSSDPEEFDGVRTYALAKRAAHTLTREWASRVAGTEFAHVRFHSMHPGWADTPGIESSLPRFHRILGPVLRTPSEGVDTTLWLAAASEPRRSNGQLWFDRRRRNDSYLPWTADPLGEPARLWDWTIASARTVDPLADGPVSAGARRDRGREAAS